MDRTWVDVYVGGRVTREKLDTVIAALRARGYQSSEFEDEFASEPDLTPNLKLVKGDVKYGASGDDVEYLRTTQLPFDIVVADTDEIPGTLIRWRPDWSAARAWHYNDQLFVPWEDVAKIRDALLAGCPADAAANKLTDLLGPADSDLPDLEIVAVLP